jgi:leucyl/phenylalanyl-tRNA--protein transferase
MDKDFAGVMEGCTRPRPGKVPLNWITPRVMQAFWDAYKAGYAHSVEVWDEDGRLVGGLYGLAIGKVYFGESQFSTVTNASKVATAVHHRHLVAWGFRLCDAKWETPHLASFGFAPMTRDRFLALLQTYVDKPGRVGHWTLDQALDFDTWSAKAPVRETSSLKVVRGPSSALAFGR